MIHNGIIENYAQIKKELLVKGYEFTSDTDTEVLLNFIDDILKITIIRWKRLCGLHYGVLSALTAFCLFIKMIWKQLLQREREALW